MDWPAAIEWQADTFRNRTGIKCRLVNDGYEPELTKNQATALFRIFQELLTNIIRHAEAKDVIVRLEKQDGELRLQVEDNGRGITEDEINSPHAFGLLGIRERLYPMGGQVCFQGTGRTGNPRHHPSSHGKKSIKKESLHDQRRYCR